MHEVISVLNSCGFRLNKFISNLTFILERLPKTEISSKYVNLDLNSVISERMLGLIWNIENDVFTFKPVITDLPENKRGILSIISSVIDPLGILTYSKFNRSKIYCTAVKEGKGRLGQTYSYLPKQEMKSMET